MLFKEVIGQQEVKQHLVEMVQHNRISHALLFLGKEGSGALPLAFAFANYVSLLPTSGALLVFGANGLQPVEHIAIGELLYELPPFGNVVGA